MNLNTTDAYIYARKKAVKVSPTILPTIEEKVSQQPSMLIEEEESFFDKNKMLIIGAGAIAAIFIGMRFMK